MKDSFWRLFNTGTCKRCPVFEWFAMKPVVLIEYNVNKLTSQIRSGKVWIRIRLLTASQNRFSKERSQTLPCADRLCWFLAECGLCVCGGAARCCVSSLCFGIRAFSGDTSIRRGLFEFISVLLLFNVPFWVAAFGTVSSFSFFSRPFALESLKREQRHTHNDYEEKSNPKLGISFARCVACTPPGQAVAAMLNPKCRLPDYKSHVYTWHPSSF